MNPSGQQRENAVGWLADIFRAPRRNPLPPDENDEELERLRAEYNRERRRRDFLAPRAVDAATAVVQELARLQHSIQEERSRDDDD